MHFFLGYTKLSVLKILIYTTLTLLDIIKESIFSILDIIKESIFSILDIIKQSTFSICNLLGPSYLIEQEPSSYFQENNTPTPTEPPLSAVLLRELLPAIKFSDLDSREQPPECVVCLDEFEGDEEIRCMKNCQHFFHSECIDGWMNHDRKSCPLCRKSLVPVDLQDEYNHRLWAASCSDYDLYGQDYQVPIF